MIASRSVLGPVRGLLLFCGCGGGRGNDSEVSTLWKPAQCRRYRAEEAGTPELHLAVSPESQSDPSCSSLEIDASREAREKSLWTRRYCTRPERNATERHSLLVKNIRVPSGVVALAFITSSLEAYISVSSRTAYIVSCGTA